MAKSASKSPCKSVACGAGKCLPGISGHFGFCGSFRALHHWRREPRGVAHARVRGWHRAFWLGHQSKRQFRSRASRQPWAQARLASETCLVNLVDRFRLTLSPSLPPLPGGEKYSYDHYAHSVLRGVIRNETLRGSTRFMVAPMWLTHRGHELSLTLLTLSNQPSFRAR